MLYYIKLVINLWLYRCSIVENDIELYGKSVVDAYDPPGDYEEIDDEYDSLETIGENNA